MSGPSRSQTRWGQSEYGRQYLANNPYATGQDHRLLTSLNQQAYVQNSTGGFRDIPGTPWRLLAASSSGGRRGYDGAAYYNMHTREVVIVNLGAQGVGELTQAITGVTQNPQIDTGVNLLFSLPALTDPFHMQPYEPGEGPGWTCIPEHTRVHTGGDDIFVGGQAGDHLNGRAGHDWLDAQGGDDNAFGEHGEDVLLGGAGADLLWEKRLLTLLRWTDKSLDRAHRPAMVA